VGIPLESEKEYRGVIYVPHSAWPLARFASDEKMSRLTRVTFADMSCLQIGSLKDLQLLNARLVVDPSGDRSAVIKIKGQLQLRANSCPNQHRNRGGGILSFDRSINVSEIVTVKPLECTAFHFMSNDKSCR
jgi:hypothetical protein